MSRLIMLGLLLASTSSGAAPLGYAKATSQLGLTARPAAYQPLNLLDGKEESVWCEGAAGDGVGEKVLIGFKESARIDEVRLTTGDVRDARAFLAHHRVKKLAIRSASSVHTVTLVDGRAPQSFKLSPPLEGSEVELEILEVLPGTAAADAACLSDVVFLVKGRPLNGPFLADKLTYNRGRALMMSTWYAGPEGAPDRTLAFYYDGTFRYSHRPYDPEEKPVDLKGEYSWQNGRLLVKLPGKVWVDAKAKRSVKHDEDGFARATMELGAEGFKETLAATWKDYR